MSAAAPSLDAAWFGVRSRIAEACDRSGREPESVRLVAVSKTVSAERVRALATLGQEIFGENRVQEALAKIPFVGLPARWHLVGHLQTNKARHAVGVFDLIHGVDDARLAVELDRRAAAAGLRQAVLLQINLSGEATKSGIAVDEAARLLDTVLPLAHLELRGLMTIPPPEDDPERSRPWFSALRDLRDRLQSRAGRPLPELSMGMTDDFEVAIEEGATLVRVGRAIFGERPAASPSE